jgi:glucosamine kinase
MVFPLNSHYDYLIGVDGGGSGTRVRIEHPDGALAGCGASGPSALANGVELAWSAIRAAIADAFAGAGLAAPPLSCMAIGLGMAGAHNRQRAAVFAAQNPGFGTLALATDGFTTLLGAHDGQPGAVIAIGTGSIGEMHDAQGNRREVGGWGFPASDEGSGAWMGLRAINHAQRSLDGRAAMDAFARAVIDFCGGSRASLFDWLAQANQAHYARLAPVVLAHAGQPAANDILRQAGAEIDAIADALEPTGALPLALCGGLAAPLRPYLPASLVARISEPRGDATVGALHLLRQELRKQDVAGLTPEPRA